MFKVVSDIVAGKNPGDTITAEELEGINIDALLEAGHIVKATATKKKEEGDN